MSDEELTDVPEAEQNSPDVHDAPDLDDDVETLDADGEGEEDSVADDEKFDLAPLGDDPGGRRMRTGTEAVAASRRWTTNQYGMCLYTVQTWLAAPWSGPWAEDAWNRWGGQHRGDKNPPAGVPVYWHNPRSKYGHIALSVGGGRIRCTDYPSSRRVGELTIDQMSAVWNIQYLGWAERFSGGAIQGLHVATAHSPSPWSHGDVYASKLHYGQRNSDSVRRLQYRLNRMHGVGADTRITGYFGPQTARKVKKALEKMGHHHHAARPLNHQSVGIGEAHHLFGSHYSVHHG